MLKEPKTKGGAEQTETCVVSILKFEEFLSMYQQYKMLPSNY